MRYDHVSQWSRAVESLTYDAVLLRVAALERAAHERALLIVGEAGMGKSRLLETVWENARVRSELVRVNPSTSNFALAGLSSIIIALQNGNDATYGTFALRSPGSHDLFTVTNEVIELLRALTLPPTLVLIDDFDRMDDESQALVGIMAGRLGGTGVRIVATAGDAEFTGSRSGMPTVKLSPLTLDQVVEQTLSSAAEVDATEIDAAALRIVAGYSGGNPTVLDEQMRKINHYQLAGKAWLTLPPRLTQAPVSITKTMLAGLSSRARELLVMASMAPLSSFASLGMLSDDAPDVLDELLGTSLLSQRGQYVQVTDPRVRTTLYRQLSARERREKHAELAIICAQHDKHVAAWHRSFGFQRKLEIDGLFGGAIWLVSRGRIHEAVEFAERALSWAERVEDHAAMLVQLCSGLLSSAHFRLAARYCAGAQTDILAPEQALSLATVRLIAETGLGQVQSDADVMTAVGKYGTADPDGATLLLIVATLYRTAHWDLDEARILLATTAELSTTASAHVQQRLKVMTEILDALEGTPADAKISDVNLILSESTPSDLLLLQGRALMWHERHSQARVAFSRAMSHAEATSTLWPGLANFARIDNEIAAGQFRLARTAAAGSVHLVNEATRRAPLAAFIVAWEAYSLGDIETARCTLDSCIDASSRDVGDGVHARALALRGVINLLEHDLEPAVMDFRQVSTMSSRLRNPTLLRHWGDYVETCVRTGRPQEARGAVEALEHRLRTHHSRWGELAVLRCRALLLTGTASIELLTKAIKSFTPDDSSYELGRTLVCLARRQDAMGMTAESRNTQMLAVAAFERAGADGWARRSAPRAAVSAVGTSPLDQLNDQEREIVRRVQDGQHTREIAEGLYLSVRTIELRLTGIYRALGVTSRAQLVLLLSQ